MFSVMRLAALGAVLALSSGLLFATVTLSPSPGVSAPSPSPSPISLPAGVDLEAGTTYVVDDPCCVLNRVIFTVPAAGWSTNDTIWLGKDVPGGASPFDLWLQFPIIENIYTDPCQPLGTELDPPVGSSSEDLATALVAQPLQNATAAPDATVGGHSAKVVELSIPAGLNPNTTCYDQEIGRWQYPNVPRSVAWSFGPGQRDTLYIMDIDGTRQVVDAMSLPRASEADLAELEAIIASIRFEPLANPAPMPSPST